MKTVFQDFETATLKEISVYSVTLHAPFSSSDYWPAIKCFFRMQFSVVDYHVFVVLLTEHGRYFAVEKQRDGVYVTHVGNLDSVLFYYNGANRANPIRELIKAQSTSLLGDIVRHLNDILPTNCYRNLMQITQNGILFHSLIFSYCSVEVDFLYLHCYSLFLLPTRTICIF